MTTLKIDGMSCEHCVRAVAGALEKVPGVETVVEVSLERGEAHVEGSAEPAALMAAIEQEGYSAEVVE
jgi:copper chaperone